MHLAEANTLFLRHRDYVANGRSHNHLARALRKGELVHVAPGVYIAAATWNSSFPETQHKMRVYAQHPRLDDVVFSHHSAAAVHDFKLLGRWPDRVCVTLPPRQKKGGRSSAAVIRRTAELSPDDIVEIDGMRVTSPARTAVDLSLTLPFDEGVAMVDSIRHWRRPLLTLGELSAALDVNPRRRGAFKALKVLEFSTDLSDSVQESRSRVLVHELRCDGRTYRADFCWDDHRHWGEFDGKGKYLSPDYRDGRSADQVVLAEKQREDAIRRNVEAFSRWDIRDLNEPQRLYRILTRAGLPRQGRRMLPS